MLENTSGTPILDRKASTPPKCYLDTEKDVVEWMLDVIPACDRELFQSYLTEKGEHNKAKYKSFACSIMDLADDISFGIHDMEDVLALKLVDREQFERHVTSENCSALLDYLSDKYPDEYSNNVYNEFANRLFANGEKRKHQINRILNFIITSVNIEDIDEFSEPRLRYRATMPQAVLKFIKATKDFVKKEVIYSPSVQHLELKGQMMVIAVFEVVKSNPKSFLPRDIYAKYEANENNLRIICDYLAGMTDAYLLKTYDRLFSPRMGSVFDKL